MNSAAAIAELPAQPVAEGARKARGREGKGTKRGSAKPKANALDRYFLANGSSGEEVAMGRELGSEQEALVAAFQEKATFFVVTEYRVETQFKGANALLVKEGVSRADR
ncbi:MAG: hypothetical protein JOZ62_24435 [Acidobacteriaceae bacterium]|nr:hypothetical protein [Acidobacteriaceae bacterium]